jgi:large subunit ribosomal protein L31
VRLGFDGQTPRASPHLRARQRPTHRAFARPVEIGRASKEHRDKAGIHPGYHEITVVMTDGTELTTRSCYGKASDTMRIDIDPKSHPAWTGQQRIVDSGGQVAKFNKRFAGLGLKNAWSFAPAYSGARPGWAVQTSTSSAIIDFLWSSSCVAMCCNAARAEGNRSSSFGYFRSASDAQ